MICEIIPSYSQENRGNDPCWRSMSTFCCAYSLACCNKAVFILKSVAPVLPTRVQAIFLYTRKGERDWLKPQARSL